MEAGWQGNVDVFTFRDRENARGRDRSLMLPFQKGKDKEVLEMDLTAIWRGFKIEEIWDFK